MFNAKRRNYVDKKKLDIAKYKEDIAAVHGNGEESSSFSLGAGSSLHEVDNCTLKVAKWLIENQKHMAGGKTYCTSSSLSLTLSKSNDNAKGIDQKVVVDIAVDIVEDVDEKKQKNTEAIDEATSFGRMRNFEMAGEVQNSFLTLRGCFRKVVDECRESFNWNDFFYSLISGFLPTAWDVYTDISLGLKLEKQEDVYTAGLCWMFVCLPPVFLIIEKLAKKKHSTWVQLLLLGLAVCF